MVCCVYTLYILKVYVHKLNTYIQLYDYKSMYIDHIAILQPSTCSYTNKEYVILKIYVVIRVAVAMWLLYIEFYINNYYPYISIYCIFIRAYIYVGIGHLTP